MDDVFTLDTPAQPLPLVFDSPHSGRTYPEDFMPACPDYALNAAEDRYVDKLYNNASNHGISFLKAEFPRTYIDPNRAVTDIDEDLLDAPWPYDLCDKGRSHAGIGLIRRLIRQNMPVYDHKLTVNEAKARIDNYYTPYHNKLDKILKDLHQQYGEVWHIDCHSMPSVSAPVVSSGLYLHPTMTKADFVIGDRDGTSCHPEFTSVVKTILEDLGYRVTLNNPYKGVEIVKRYGRPYEGLHSIQLEINKGVYLDEATQELNKNFVKVQADLNRFMEIISSWVSQKIMPLAAD